MSEKTSLEIILDKIHCIEEIGWDWAGSDEVYAVIDVDDGKHPIARIRDPEPAHEAAYQRYHKMDSGDTIDVNRSIYTVTDVGPYIQLNISAFDEEIQESTLSVIPLTNIETSDRLIGSCQIKFTQSENWGKGKKIKVRCGGPKACLDFYFSLK